MILFPNAKINLGLNIIEKRADGYHNIETVMYPLNWCDILEIVPCDDDTTLTVSGRHVDCLPEKNLVMKAYKLFQAETGIGNVKIFLHKIIPDGAGLGGGSADAAFTFIGLNEIFSCGKSREQLAAMASKIGADCPFFIYNEPCLATGIGIDIKPIEMSLKGTAIVVAKPQVSVPTAKAYAGVMPHPADRNLAESLTQPVTCWNGIVKNDFETSVFPSYPEIEATKQTMIEIGACYAAMSGSGSAVFGLFEKCDILAEDIKKRFPNCDTFIGVL